MDNIPLVSKPNLAICRDESALRSLISAGHINLSETIVASDDLDVHTMAKKYEPLRISKL